MLWLASLFKSVTQKQRFLEPPMWSPLNRFFFIVTLGFLNRATTLAWQQNMAEFWGIFHSHTLLTGGKQQTARWIRIDGLLDSCVPTPIVGYCIGIQISCEKRQFYGTFCDLNTPVWFWIPLPKIWIPLTMKNKIVSAVWSQHTSSTSVDTIWPVLDRGGSLYLRGEKRWYYLVFWTFRD